MFTRARESKILLAHANIDRIAPDGVHLHTTCCYSCNTYTLVASSVSFSRNTKTRELNGALHARRRLLSSAGSERCPSDSPFRMFRYVVKKLH